MDKTKTKTESEDFQDESEDQSPWDAEPERKLAKLSSPTALSRLTVNPTYLKKEFVAELKKRWNAKSDQDYKDPGSGVVVYGDPYQICLLPELLEHKETCLALVNEMIEKIHWSRKQMDLYEFYQSTDLSNMSTNKLLTDFLQMLRRDVRPWLESVTGMKLDYVSASCSMYTCGDYLLVHDDLLKDRQIAFVYYLSPWSGAEQWTEAYGGCLEIFDSDQCCFPQFPVKRKIPPKNNQFAFFKVGSRSFHQVGEVTQFDYPRLTINGWFHGASNDDLIADTLRPFAKPEFVPPTFIEFDLNQLLNEVYLTPSTRRNIQKRIEENSEICLYDFFKREVFDEVLRQLLSDSNLKWCRQGPANAQNYEILDVSSASSAVAKMANFFGSEEMFWLLRDYTDLDLAGSDAITPTCHFEFQRWSQGNYTVLGDGAICDDNILDLVYYLNAADGAGIITYLTPEMEADEMGRLNGEGDYGGGRGEDDDSVLLTITPVDNSLNIVYRCEGTTKFTKYVSRNTPLEKGPVFVIACSYKE